MCASIHIVGRHLGPMVDLPHLVHAPPWQEQSRAGHNASVLPVSHARSHINQKGDVVVPSSTPMSPGASCVWDGPCWPCLPLITHCHCFFGLVNSEPATADQIQGRVRSRSCMHRCIHAYIDLRKQVDPCSHFCAYKFTPSQENMH